MPNIESSSHNSPDRIVQFDNPETEYGLTYQVITEVPKIPEGDLKGVIVFSWGRNSMIPIIEENGGKISKPHDSIADKVDRIMQRSAINAMFDEGYIVISASYPELLSKRHSPRRIRSDIDSIAKELSKRANLYDERLPRYLVGMSSGTPSIVESASQIKNVQGVGLIVPAVNTVKIYVPDQQEAISRLENVPRVVVASTIIDPFFDKKYVRPFVYSISEVVEDTLHGEGILPHHLRGPRIGFAMKNFMNVVMAENEQSEIS